MSIRARFAIVSLLAATLAAPALAVDIFGITSDGRLLNISAQSGAGTQLFDFPDNSWESLERKPNSNAFVAIAMGNTLINVDPFGGIISTIGVSGLPHVEALALNRTTQVLFAAVSTNADFAAESLATINPNNGVATVIGPFGGLADVDALAWDPVSQQLFAADLSSGAFGTVNPLTGAFSPLGAVSGLVAALDFAPNGTLYGAAIPGVLGGPTNLVTIDPATGATTLIGPIGFETVSGLVATVPEPAPLLATLSLLLLPLARHR